MLTRIKYLAEVRVLDRLKLDVGCETLGQFGRLLSVHHILLRFNLIRQLAFEIVVCESNTPNQSIFRRKHKNNHRNNQAAVIVSVVIVTVKAKSKASRVQV